MGETHGNLYRHLSALKGPDWQEVNPVEVGACGLTTSSGRNLRLLKVGPSGAGAVRESHLHKPGGLERQRCSAMTENREVLAALRSIDTALGTELFLEQVVRLLQRQRPHYHWVGVYLLQGQELVLGPFVGKPTPHTRIPLNRGICGAAASTGQTIVVDDVNSDPRYLACSLETRSEIVVPLKRNQQILGEIDIDSDQPSAFTDNDREWLEAVAEIVAARL